MEYLFDADKPHFRVWVTLCDIDTTHRYGKSLVRIKPYIKSPVAPLYYAALCGFHDLVERLISEYPQDVNADGGNYLRPILAALATEHFKTADLLRHNGADLNIRGPSENTPLHSAVDGSGHIKVAQKLIEYDVNINTVNGGGYTPLHWASYDRFKGGFIPRLLLKHGADVNARGNDGSTPLHEASESGALEVARVLAEYGADVDAKDLRGRTALEVASAKGYDEFVKFLREQGGK